MLYATLTPNGEKVVIGITFPT